VKAERELMMPSLRLTLRKRISKGKSTKRQYLGGIELNDQFRQALDMMEHTSKSIFITGRAGTGKSTLLTYFRHTTEKGLPC